MVNRYGDSVQFSDIEIKGENIKIKRCESMMVLKELLARMGLRVKRKPHSLKLTPNKE